MRRVSLPSLCFAAICKTSIAIASDCSQHEEPQLAIAAYPVIIAANQATTTTSPFRADSAMADYSRAIAFQPKDGAAYNNRAWVYYSARNTVRALQFAGNTLQLLPFDAEALGTQAHVFEVPVLRTDAISSYRSDLRLIPDIEGSKEGRRRSGATP